MQAVASILIVDDHPPNLIALAALLAPLGHRIVAAKSGDDAVRLALQEPFAVVLMDVCMPGLDGYATARLLRSREAPRHTPIIFVTAQYSPENAAEAYAAGAVDLLFKPLEPNIVRSKVEVFATLYKQARALEDAAKLVGELEASEAANRAKDDFLAMVSHELRTPLNVIVGWAEMIRSGKLTLEKVQQGAETIVRNARVQSQLVADLLDISRIVAGKFLITPHPMRLDLIVQEAVDSLRPQAVSAGIDLRSSIPDDAEELRIDPPRIHQVVCNLVGNAIKFTPRGGWINVEVARAGDFFDLTVTDSGRGIRPDFLPYVFDRFQQANSSATREHGGLGLGLAIVRHIVECHCGRISAFSKGEDQGARFTVHLPLRANVPTELPCETTGKTTAELRVITVEEQPGELAGLRLLIVDDEADSRELLQTILAGAGAVVAVADGVDAALAQLTSELDLVVSDLAMPRRDGFDLARELAGRRRLPMIAVSALSSNEDKARALEAGFMCHLSKPFDASTLIALVGRLARGSDRRRNPRYAARDR